MFLVHICRTTHLYITLLLRYIQYQLVSFVINKIDAMSCCFPLFFITVKFPLSSMCTLHTHLHYGLLLYMESTWLTLAHILTPNFISHGVVTLLVHVCWLEQALDYRKQPHQRSILAVFFTKVSLLQQPCK